jgi:hypothetical protein
VNIKLFHFGSILLSIIGVAVQGCSMAPQTVRLAPQVQAVFSEFAATWVRMILSNVERSGQTSLGR